MEEGSGLRGRQSVRGESVELSVPKWPIEAQIINSIRTEEIRQRYYERVRFDSMPGDYNARRKWLAREFEELAVEIVQRADDFLDLSGKDKKKLAVEWLKKAVGAADDIIGFPMVPKVVARMTWKWFYSRVPGWIEKAVAK